MTAGARSSLLPSKPAKLTKNNLRLCNWPTGTKSASEKDFGQVSISDAESAMYGHGTTEKPVSTVSPGFAAQAWKNSMLDRLDSRAPTNLDDQRAYTKRRRESVSPSAATYRNYRRAVGTAPNEQTVLVGVAQGLLRGCDDGGDEGYDRVCNQAFTA